MSTGPRKSCAPSTLLRQSSLRCLRRFFYCTKTEVTQWEKPELPDDGADESHFRELPVRTPLCNPPMCVPVAANGLLLASRRELRGTAKLRSATK